VGKSVAGRAPGAFHLTEESSMTPRIAVATSAMLLVLGTAACDRRDAEPIESADSATSTIDDSPEIAPLPAQVDVDGPCAGLTGEAVDNCEGRVEAGTTPESENEGEVDIPATEDSPTPLGD
jgi:hypothetical protein